MIKKYSINIIEKELKNLIDDNQDLLLIYKDTTSILNDINSKRKIMFDNIGELLNFLLKTPLRKILIKFDDKNKVVSYSRFTSYYEIGVNKKGVGIVEGSYSKNLVNILDSWNEGVSLFLGILKGEGNKDYFINSIKDKEKREIVIKILKENKFLKSIYSYNFKEVIDSVEINKIKFIFEDSLIINYFSKRGLDEGFDFNFLDDIKLGEEEDYLKEVSVNTFSGTYSQIKRFIFLVNRKGEIIPFLEGKLKELRKIKEEIEKEIGISNEYLKPYRALQEI